MLGSAATDFAWLAAGRLDAVVMHSNKTWDVSAGIAIARAAGALVTHHDGTPYTIAGPAVLATAPELHAAMVDLLSST
jgi:myo-inositol-1(or 4)-monophosphatase